MRDEIWEGHLAPRLIDRKGRALVISTPLGKGWFYDMYLRGSKKLDPECESWALPSRDNPHVDAATIEAERGRMPPEKFAQQYESKFLDVPGDPCEQCGGPREAVPGWITLSPEHNYEDVPTCPSCGMFVDSDGRCIVKYHNAWAASLWLRTDGESAHYSWSSLKADGNWR
jgi:hypothetical protein